LSDQGLVLFAVYVSTTWMVECLMHLVRVRA